MGLVHLPSSHTDTHIWIGIHNGIDLSTDLYIGVCYFAPFGAKSYKSTNTDPYILLFTKMIYYQSLGEDFFGR